MARPTDKIEKFNRECKTYKKLAEKALELEGVAKTKQIEIAKESLEVAAKNIVSDFYVELTHAYYTEAEMDKPKEKRSEEALNHWLNRYDLPHPIEDRDAYTPLVCLCLSLDTELFDVLDFIGFDYGIADNKKSEYQRLIERTYQGLLIPIYMLSQVDAFSLLYLKAKKLVESGKNQREYEAIVTELGSTLEIIRTIAEVIDPITGFYSKELAEQSKLISQRRIESSMKRHDKNIPLCEEEYEELLAVFQLMLAYLKSKNRSLDDDAVVDVCVRFVCNFYYIDDAKTKAHMLACIEAFKLFNPDSSFKAGTKLDERTLDKTDKSIYPLLFTQVALKYRKELGAGELQK